MKFLFSIGLLVVACASVTLGYNDVLTGTGDAGKCETCKYYMKFYNTGLHADEVEEVYREFYELAQNSEEDVCSNFCVQSEFIESAAEKDTAVSDESTEDRVENLIAHVGCATCMHIVLNVGKHIHNYTSFRSIILGFKYACFHEVTHVCRSFLTQHEDHLIDAIYHFKNNQLQVCRSIHQC